MSLAGRLEDLALSDIFQILSIGKKTGTLVIKGSKGTALIVFRNGLIIRAESDDFSTSLVDNLLRAGLINDSNLYRANELKKKLPSKTAAEILFDLGFLKQELLEEVAKKRIETIICRLFLWDEGGFQFDPDDLDIEGKTDLSDLGWEISEGLSPEYLLMEGARVYDEFSKAPFIAVDEISLENTDEKERWDEDWISSRTERKDITALKLLSQELRFPNSTSEITLLVLRFASDIFQRGVLFMISRNEMIKLGQFGVGDNLSKLKRSKDTFPFDGSTFLRNIITEQIIYKGPLNRDEGLQYLIDLIGGKWPSEAAIFPLTAEGKTVAILYCDNIHTGSVIGETEGLEIFINHAGLAIEKSLLQRRLLEKEKQQPDID